MLCIRLDFGVGPRRIPQCLFNLIEAEPEPSVRAVLGHCLFGYIHPYSDGNGRKARFLMNVLLASGGPDCNSR
ncbi:Fic family protein [Edaphobacter aggregans]|uniref:Fic family protein n=1 Tax=Edaphobacter aggregans TaxID=570835 RepID=UPI001B80038D